MSRPKPFLFLGGLVLAAALLYMPAGLWAGPVELKVAAVTPEGSAWVRVLREMTAEVENQTQGGIRFKIYPGGVSGDEADVLRKMQVNRIQAAGFSGVGLGLILPELRVLEAPLLFENEAEIDHARTVLFDYFAKAFEDKGFILLGFVEGGWVYLFSRHDLTGDEGFAAAKMWVWQGDQVAETFLNTFGVKTIPLNIADVNTGLETGMIDSFYAPPLAAVAFQWYTRVGHMLDYPMAGSTGALLMTRRAFAALPPEHQQILRQTAAAYCRKLIELTRQDNAEALTVLQSRGVAFERPTPERIEQFKADARKTYAKSIPDLYPQTLFDRLQAELSRFRAKTNAALPAGQ